MTLIAKVTIVMINMIAELRKTIAITEKNNNSRNNDSNTFTQATQVTIKTQTMNK